MRALMVEALCPFVFASAANCDFQSSKPAAVLPHCGAAPALLPVDMSASAMAIAVNGRPMVIGTPLSDEPSAPLKRSLYHEPGNHGTSEAVRVGTAPIKKGPAEAGP